MENTVKISMVGGPTALLELGALRLLTDPTLDPPRHHKSETGLEYDKLAGPDATLAATLLPIDAVLLSHDAHFDNLDEAGRALLAEVPLVLTTPEGASRLGGPARGLAPFESVEIGEGALTVTAVPARHGPAGAEEVLGEVTGFWLTGDGLPSVYVSGDNASLELVEEIGSRLGSPDVAMLFGGGVFKEGLLGGELLTMNGERIAAATRILDPSTLIPLHDEGWSHYTEPPEAITAAVDAAGLSDRLQMLAPGESRIIPAARVPRDDHPL
jgi:L-ascorbate metabolism protein UlaG (beta-lactamase superfamily)